MNTYPTTWLLPDRLFDGHALQNKVALQVRDGVISAACT
jgi:hypothetical protein